MPWNQLTTLLFQSRTTGNLDECREIILQCINLVSVTLYVCGWDFSQSHTSPIVVLPFLEDIQISFTLEDEGFSRIEPFFAPLALPALKMMKIEIEMCDVEFSWDAGKFSEFQDRAPNIERLTFELDGDNITDMDANSLITLLRHSPALTNLSFDLCERGIDETFLHALQLDEHDSRPLVPRLRRLALRNIGSRPSDSAAKSMVRSRWWTGAVPPLSGVARLESLDLRRKWCPDGASSLSQELRTNLKEYEIQGLRMYLS
ncbi:hypothetical protein DFH09DRAFT_1342761 [Mycena vulgaris]|nr:hypothetical protein DFH09DRAFT_1342761 [Mycena vulgaris]